MQKSEDIQTTKVARRKVGVSTTLNRKYVKKPEKSAKITEVQIKRSPKVRHFQQQPIVEKKVVEKKVVDEQPIQAASIHPIQAAANSKMRERQLASQAQSQKQKISAQELKEQAIRKALSVATRADADEEPEQDDIEVNKKMHFGVGRVLLALSCATVAVFAIVYFVNLNMPDISLKVAAMQSGLEASYPSYIPRDYSLTSITSEDGKIVLNFKNRKDEKEFSITEEKSSWDSSALYSNYVKTTFDENYSMIREQGLTIYISDSNAAWVNGGIVYKLMANNGTLSKKQISSIATSL